MSKEEKEKKPFYKKWWFWVIVVIVVICLSNPSAFKEGFEEGYSGNTTISNSSTSSTETKTSEEAISNKTEEVKEEVTTTKEPVVFLEGTKGKEFYEILTEVAGIKQKTSDNTQDLGNSIMYEVVNDYYSVEVCTNKSDEIGYIRVMVFKEDKNNNSKNLFMALSRLEYNGATRSDIVSFISENYGKEASKKIGDLNFEFSLGTTGKPILECKTEGFDDFILSDV